ncbi:MAG TPA: DinB family protein [Blastocatellia bacterium]|nr:DinB family protein [Blastocatellia bacterium]
MKTIRLSLILLVLVSLASAGVSSPLPSTKDPKMTADERARIIKLLLDSQKEYIDGLERLTDAQWGYKPSPLKWSVGEVAEHIVLTEIALFSNVNRALAQKPNPDWETKTEGKAAFIERVVPSRANRAQAPVEVRPSGKLTRDEVIKRYKEVRAKVLEFVRTTDLPLKAHTVEHPFRVFNTLSAYDWLVYIPTHNIRHNQQIAEVKATAGYPRQ